MMTSHNDLPPVHFVLGAGAGSSAALHDLLCHHRGVAFVSNLDDRLPGAHITSGMNGALYRSLSASPGRGRRLGLTPSAAHRALAREVSPQLSWSRRDLGAADATPWLTERLRRFVRRRTSRQPGAVFVHRLTGWTHAGLLRAVFPRARFVHVVRDGRSVANAWLQQPRWPGHRGPGLWQWGELDPVHRRLWEHLDRTTAVLAGIGWMVAIDAAGAQRRRLPHDAWLEVRHEDLVDRPLAVLDEVTSLFDLPDDPALDAALTEHGVAAGPGADWRDDLGPELAASLTQVMASHLAAHGYPARV